MKGNSNYSIIEKEGLYTVIHEQFATDRYELGNTIVSASSKEEAMKKLNDYLSTGPDGVYTGLPCKDINHVWPLSVLE